MIRTQKYPSTLTYPSTSSKSSRPTFLAYRYVHALYRRPTNGLDSQQWPVPLLLKWHLKCENILECELVALPEQQKWKKVIAWSGDCGMDQYVSWNLSSNELTLNIIWGKYEEYCKLQSNEVWARFDLLTSFCQGTCSVDEWYNAVQAQVNLAKYPPEMAKILHRDIFWFFLRDEEFVSRTISDGSVDLEKFPVSRVQQLAKKLESSKATARHIKKVSGEPHAAQINLLRHQRMELPQQRHNKKKSHAKFVQSSTKLQCGNDLSHGQKIKGNHFLPPSKQAATLWQPQSVLKMWWHSTSGRVHMPSKKAPVQGMSQVWPLH